ncbi:MAG: folylpolyglutamate synthase/dihydrofolate synthase family protein [Hyphomicrobiaceae bacterium]
MAAMPSSDAILAELKTLYPLLIDLSLDRVVRLLGALADPHRRLPPVIHVAGTNGKGSTCAFLKAMLEAAGRRVHVYTSPHLVRFSERIQLAGADGKALPIDETRLIALLQRVKSANAGQPITFFEITTAAAFLAFAETPADCVILEVGLGGRLDTTNVVERPELTVITPISIDHAEKLGGTLAAIAREKAGIIKPRVPCVVSDQPDEALIEIELAAVRARAPLIVRGRDYDAFAQSGRLVFQREDSVLDLPLPALFGRHQIANAGTSVAAALALPAALAPGEAAIEAGLLAAEWPARMAKLQGGPLGRIASSETELWLDGGHNPAAGVALAETLADLDERSPKPVALIVGMMGQKDAAGFLAPFRGVVGTLIAVPIAGAHEAPHPPEPIAEIARGLGIAALAAGSVPEALSHVETLISGPKRVLICGSLYLAGSVLALQQGVPVQSN